MAAPTIDESKPTFGANPVDAAMTQLRNNVTWLVAMAILNGGTIPYWNAAPSGADLSKPDYIEATHSVDGRKVKVAFSYTGDNCTGIVISFNDGGGYATFTKGTAVNTYNGSGQWTGTTWS